MIRQLAIAPLLIGLAGCSTTGKEFFNDSTAAAASQYCKGVYAASKRSPRVRALSDRQRVVVRREIVQRGEYGPGLEMGDGPVIIALCKGDSVPEAILQYLEKPE